MVKPKIWSGLEVQVYDALVQRVELLEELLGAGEGSATHAERAAWREQLRQARAELRDFTDRAEGR